MTLNVAVEDVEGVWLDLLLGERDGVSENGHPGPQQLLVGLLVQRVVLHHLQTNRQLASDQLTCSMKLQ